jgi:hypothetical protein
MDKYFYLLASLFIFSTNSLFSNSTETEKRTPEETIELFGLLRIGDARNEQPIRVTNDNGRLEIEFSEALEVINLEIADESGSVIYTENYNTSIESQTDIYLYGLEGGNYSISFVNEAGGYLFGDFNLE